MQKKFFYGVEYVALLLAIIVFWQLMNVSGRLNPVVLPAPAKVLGTFESLVKQGTLLSNLLISIVRVLKGYFLAMGLGLILGIFIGLFEHVRRITDLLVQIIKPIPPIAWIPLVILWFGIGESGKIFLIFLGGFFTMLVNVVDGIRQADVKLLEVSEVAETPFAKHVVKVIIPGAAPNIFTGFRVGLSSCWMCVVAAELVSSNTGLGYMIMNARQFGQTDVVIVGMLIIGLIGKLMDSLLKLIESRVIKWV
ncbi:ABC transporter permease [Eubacterium oxidoreducens]|uniref:Sulfonate transport system permease protein n=1 Tax=Eubacterium oxidoreducens TaxID=1732 RepID=A0A1G6A313_EUBOX|nr:ABC transporter permease [Eubacterium oxidoreducens]SDB02606.1 sulfonate transport system permease protein [Eubacterium oxidoreducens]